MKAPKCRQKRLAGALKAGVCQGGAGHWFSKYIDSLHHLHSKREGILIPHPLRIYACGETVPGVTVTVHLNHGRKKAPW